MQKDYCKNLCPLPWTQFSVNADTSLRVCCNTYHGGHARDDEGQKTFIAGDESIDSLFNKKTHRDLRKAMLNGERPDFCKSCYDIEDNGGHSSRMSYFHSYEHRVQEFIDSTDENGSIPEENIKFREIDFALSNNCNLKCRMCTPSCSTSLKSEFDKLNLGYFQDEHFKASRYWHENKSIRSLFENYSENIENILTTGGEPLISKEHQEHLRILKKQNRHHNIKLVYHTSLTKLPPELFELWKGFKKIQIHLSLEGTGAVNDYVRHPSKWSDITANLITLTKHKDQIDFNLQVHSCIQAMSWTRHFEVLNFSTFLQNLEIETHFLPFPIWLESPTELRVLNLPPELRELGIERVEKALDQIASQLNRPLASFENDCIANYRSIIKRLRALPYHPEDFDSFKKRVKLVDDYRGQNIAQVIPDFAPYF